MSLALLAIDVRAQVVMSEAQARQIIEPLWAAPCVSLPLGRRTLKTFPSEADKNLYDQTVALWMAGVVRLTDLRKGPTNEPLSLDKFIEASVSLKRLDVDVALRDDVDRAQIGNRSPTGPCLRTPPIRIEKIAKIDPVRGGSTLKWDGAVAYLVWHREPASALVAAYIANLPPSRQIGDRGKALLLFRHDPFTTQWRLVAIDFAAIHAQEFPTKRVSTALQRD
jgi:hypothetical protein